MMGRPAFEPRIFEPGDPDSAVACPPIVMLNDGPALRTDDMRLTVGVRKDGGEDLLIVMRTMGGGTTFAPLTPITARALADGLNDWADGQESAASTSAASALAKAGVRK